MIAPGTETSCEDVNPSTKFYQNTPYSLRPPYLILLIHIIPTLFIKEDQASSLNAPSKISFLILFIFECRVWNTSKAVSTNLAVKLQEHKCLVRTLGEFIVPTVVFVGAAAKSGGYSSVLLVNVEFYNVFGALGGEISDSEGISVDCFNRAPDLVVISFDS